MSVSGISRDYVSPMDERTVRLSSEERRAADRLARDVKGKFRAKLKAERARLKTDIAEGTSSA